MEKADPLAKNDWLTGGAKIDPITGAYTRSEDFQVQCETDVGVAKLDLRQDTKFSLKELEVLTYSLREDTAVKSYRHAIRLTPNKDATNANLELAIRIEVSVPWLWRSTARARLEKSVDSQMDSFATRFVESMENR